MKRNILLLLTSIVISSISFSQQNTAPTMAVSMPSMQGMTITPKTCSKMLFLETTKLNMFRVYDEFDVQEIVAKSKEYQEGCFGVNCLLKLGKEIGVDYVVTAGVDRFGSKIIVSIKIVDVKNNSIFKSTFKEFSNQEDELQRMIELTLRSMFSLEFDKETENQLSFKNDVITSKSLGKINNSGPRVGYAVLTGSLYEFATRSEQEGGLEAIPAFSMIGYQFEKQYIGTENFSALFEGIVNISALEQGYFIPSFAILNGFRIGKSGFEIAFGPNFLFQKTSKGFFDSNNLYGNGKDYYWTEQEYYSYANQFIDPLNPTSVPEPAYDISTFMDRRGSTKLSARWIMGIGRTFKSGSLNIPVNLFYSSAKKGGMAGISVGFNVTKKKESANYTNLE
ncbi:MAG: hypothetical protein ACK5B9_00260 [Flavobacteriia bacterium]|jgi:TolB-like protein